MVMSEWDGTPWGGTVIGPQLQTREIDPSLGSLETQITRLRSTAAQPWRLPSVNDALGVPGIQRAVTLISNTTGSLAMQGFRDGALMNPSPMVIVRPDPFNTPRDSYRDMAYQMATRGETVLWIAARDSDGLPAALVVVPLRELTVEENPRRRLFPIYTWGIGPGAAKGTRYSPANREGDFVHITYLKEPGELRGKGPLQMCGAAVSVAVEAQEWAANFFATGGVPSIWVKAAVSMNDEEAAAFKLQWSDATPNTPKITSPDTVEDIKDVGVNPQGAQMLDGRNYQNGDAARMFGLPGALLEYSQPGSSLTYQNLGEVFTNFVKTCLAPNYLEPLEQSLSDVLPRSTVGRFNVKGFLRADIRTRYDVYSIAIDKGIITPEQAQQEEGYLPGDVEYAPVPAAPPAAIPASLPQLRSVPDSFRCDGQRLRRMNGVTQLAECGKLLPAGQLRCPRCKKSYAPAA